MRRLAPRSRSPKLETAWFLKARGTTPVIQAESSSRKNPTPGKAGVELHFVVGLESLDLTGEGLRFIV